jgi:ABC-type sulfate transport system substrate-binding protein
VLVRPGNPAQVHDFEDLTRRGVKVVHPDPLTSGGANWAIVAEYVEFLWSDRAQRLFVEHGFRSVKPELNKENDTFGHIPDLFTIRDFGGWTRAKKEIVDGVWKNQVLRELNR